MKSILAIIALSAYVTASPLGSTSAPTETVPAMPLATAEWDEKMVLDGCEEEFFRFATVWKKDNKAKAVLRSSYHPATEEIIVTPVIYQFQISISSSSDQSVLMIRKKRIMSLMIVAKSNAFAGFHGTKVKIFCNWSTFVPNFLMVN